MIKIKKFEHEINGLKEKVRAMACDEIYSAKCQAYDGYASNEKEGDYGTWQDWFSLISKYGEEIIDKLFEKK